MAPCSKLWIHRCGGTYVYSPYCGHNALCGPLQIDHMNLWLLFTLDYSYRSGVMYSQCRNSIVIRNRLVHAFLNCLWKLDTEGLAEHGELRIFLDHLPNMRAEWCIRAKWVALPCWEKILPDFVNTCIGTVALSFSYQNQSIDRPKTDWYLIVHNLKFLVFNCPNHKYTLPLSQLDGIVLIFRSTAEYGWCGNHLPFHLSSYVEWRDVIR